ncbi:hypothetical protein [Desulfovermiculus halophilus]|uniref:hypothetical protein n=1 Tax=Desulfovermiculus halophilus TaxID=339722 RepID=UPI000481942C|nr:hypothetical protein [Desulfovermiculus halophilus]
MSKTQFSFEQHMENSLIIQTCYYRLEAFYRALESIYGQGHEAVECASQVMDKLNELKIHMDDLVIQEFPERKMSCVYRTNDRPKLSSSARNDS